MSVSIGILGLGYLGKQLWDQFPQFIAWGTYHQKTPPSSVLSKLPCVPFQWENSQSWVDLPDAPATLVLTIPPVLKNPDAEVERIRKWGAWMNQERPQIKQLIYISSTGVYPLADGLWKESDSFKPNRLGGTLRLETEKILAQYFETWVIRAGGIYGPERNVGQRVLDQKPITKSQRPIHRIHVADLAGIVKFLATAGLPPLCVNAVDENPQPSIALLEWLLEKQWLSFPKTDWPIHYQEDTLSICMQRFISNHKLLKEMHYSLKYPSFEEGLREIFCNSQK